MRPGWVPEYGTGGLKGLDRAFHNVQQGLAETQGRLDFAERLLSATREERRIGG